MSRGQKPRRPEFYPHMRYRGRKRHARNLRIVFWDADWRAVWPQPDPSSWTLVMSPIDRLIAEYGSLRNVPTPELMKACGYEGELSITVRRYTGLHDLDDVAAELGIDLDEPDETDTTEAQFEAMWAEGEAA